MSPNAAILERLLDLHQREARAIAEIDVDVLGAIGHERTELLGSLATPVAADLQLARQVEEARARNERAAEEQLKAIGRRIDQLGHGRRALQGYTPGGAVRPAARFLDEGA